MKKFWEYFSSLSTDGKFIFLATTPIWLPFVIFIWIVGGSILWLFLKAKAQREIAARVAPDLAKVQHSQSWQSQREHREQVKAQPRPTTNTLYGGTAPMEKPLRD